MSRGSEESCIFAENMRKRPDLIVELDRSLKAGLPGSVSQNKMAPGVRLENDRGLYRNAAVMILLYIRDERWHFVLMRRPEYPGAHSNQVSLPGGIHEEGDADLETTALRETREELGIDEASIHLVGKLSKLHIPVSGIEVTPFMGYHPKNPVFHPDPREVAYLIEVPVADLLTPDNEREEVRAILCKPVRVPYFNIGGEQVWGATAMILSEFSDVLRRLEWVDLQ